MLSRPAFCSALKDSVLLVLIIGTFFAFMLGSRPLSAPDEGRYTEISREMVASGDFVTPRLNGVKYFEKPPLMYWLTSSSIKAFGINEWALRFWPAFLGLLTCLMTYGVGRLLYGRRAGLFSAGILSSSLLFYAHTRLLILDMAVSTFIVGALFSFLLAMRETRKTERPSQRWFLVLFFVCSALAVLSKGLIGAVLPGAIILLWCTLRRDLNSLKLAFTWWGVGLFFLIAAPWHILVALKNPEFFHFYFIHEHFERFLTKAHSRYQPPWFFFPIVLLGLFPWVGLFLKTALSDVQKARRFFSANLKPYQKDLTVDQRNVDQTSQEQKGALSLDCASLFLWLSVGVIFVFFSASSSKLIPYIVPIFPLVSVLMGRYLKEVYGQPQDLYCDEGIYKTNEVLHSSSMTKPPSHASLAKKPFHPGPSRSAPSSSTPWASFVVICLLFSVGIPLALWHQDLFSHSVLYPYWISIVGTLILGASYVFWKRQNIHHTLGGIFCTSLVMLSLLNAAWPHLEHRSVKALALEINRLKQPGDHVVAFGRYYQDLPPYIEQTIIVTDWKGELEFGMSVENTRDWMMTKEDFLRLYQKGGRFFIVTRKEFLEALTHLGIRQIEKLEETHDDVLLRIGSPMNALDPLSRKEGINE